MNVQIEPVENGFLLTCSWGHGSISGSGYSGERKDRYVFVSLSEALDKIRELLTPKPFKKECCENT
jgi:hypothetical protein